LEEPAEFQLAASKIFGWFEGLKGFVIRRDNDDDGLGRIDIQAGEESLKDPAHALELVEDVAGLLLIGIGDDDEVRAGNTEPLLGGEAMSRRNDEENADKQRSQAHRSVAILATIGEGDFEAVVAGSGSRLAEG